MTYLETAKAFLSGSIKEATNPENGWDSQRMWREAARDWAIIYNTLYQHNSSIGANNV